MPSIATEMGYIEDDRLWYVYRVPRMQVSDKLPFADAGMQTFLPTSSVAVKDERGRVVRTVLRPKLPNYLFVLATPRQMQQYYEHHGVQPIIRKRHTDLSLAQRHLVVPTPQMHLFMQVVSVMDQEVTFEWGDDELLVKGDHVLVAEGPFRGVEGTLLTNQGCHQGRVYVSLASGLGVLTAQIPDEYLQVLSFRRDNTHFYKKMQAYERVLDGCLATYRTDGRLQPQQRKHLQGFLFRYSRLGELTHASHARLVACRYATHRLLAQRAQAEAELNAYKALREIDAARRRADKRSSSARDTIEEWCRKIEETLGCQI